ncbi:hypothetical protein [Peptostreptococcus porci]|nr:hypothetical protein [Peptostreptococcus porci]
MYESTLDESGQIIYRFVNTHMYKVLLISSVISCFSVYESLF